MNNVETKLEKAETVEYLRQILFQKLLICNQTRLDIPGFGRVTATSQVNYHVFDGDVIPYFTFEINKKKSGEFFKRENNYFVKYG
jgi:hypothetical protein